ncbi:glutamyl-tRNA reductase, partial [Staphylococcus haemolyticus]
NRTLSKAKILAEKHQVNYQSLDELPTLLQHADIVISSTSSESYIITNDMIESIANHRKLDSLLLVDIAVPRDIEPG